MSVTKSGVCYDLGESPYSYSWRGLTYYFSSVNHCEKFIRDVRKREQWLDDSLSRRFKVSVHLPILADVQLYAQVETRGFRIVTDTGTEYLIPQALYVEANTALLGIDYGAI